MVKINLEFDNDIDAVIFMNAIDGNLDIFNDFYLLNTGSKRKYIISWPDKKIMVKNNG